MDQSPEKDEKKSDSVVELAKKRFIMAVEATRETRKLGDEDIKFIAGEQWPGDIRRAREADGRPVLTINRCPQIIRNVTNDQRLNRPSIKVYPVDDRADVETAKIFQGLIRQIENESNAEQAYDTAFDNVVKRSYGFWRIVTEYESPTSFNQKALIKRIRNPNSVLLDPFHKEKDGSDASWGFIFEDVPHDDYKAEYPNSDLSQSTDWKIEGEIPDGWVTESSCRVTEYFVKEYKDAELILLDNGQAVLKDDFGKAVQKYAAQGILVRPVDTRQTKIPVIKWYKIDGGPEPLEENEFPGQYIPIIPVYGDEHDIDGKVIYESVIRHSKDSQRMYNVWKSYETETITLAPKAPYIAAEGQIPEEYESMWRLANQKNFPYLIYKPTDHEGNLVPPPQRQVFEPPVQAVTQASMLASEDIKNTSGVTDAAMGNRSNEQSGIAINARANQAQRNNFHIVDNLNASIRHTGRILVDIIPIIYDTPQAVRILGEDGQGEIVRLNELFNHKGEDRKFDFSIGKYDVVCETGPGYASKRQEAQSSMLEISKVNPQVMGVAGDLIVKNMDWPGASDIADRLRKTMDPKLIDDEKNKQQQLPPQVQAQMQQMDQMIQQLTEKLNEATEKEKLKVVEIESRERIEFAKLENNLVLEQMKQQGQSAQALFAAEIKEINDRLNLLRTNEPIQIESNEPIPDQEMVQDNEMQPQQLTGELSPGQPMGDM